MSEKLSYEKLEERYNTLCDVFTAESKALKIEVEEARKSELNVKHKYNDIKSKYNEVLKMAQGYEKLLSELKNVNEELISVNKALTEKIEKLQNGSTHEPEEKKNHDEEIVAILYGIVL